MSAPLNGKELARALGISETTYHQRRRLGLYRALEVSRPVGQRRYSRALVERYLAGESIAAFGSGRNVFRRTA